jgi:hypothetical protein
VFRQLSRLLGDRRADCVVLYGPRQAAVNFPQWFDYAVDWLGRAGCAADRVGISGVGYDSEKNVFSFPTALKKLQSSGFGSVTDISFYVDNSSGTSIIDNWTINLSLSYTHSMIGIFCDNNAFKFSRDDVVQTVLDMKECFDGDYGIYYHRAFRLGPAFYPYGTTVGLANHGAERKEAERISKWQHARIAANKGGLSVSQFLRDIYPMNFLSAHHLKMIVDASTLGEWIGSSSAHGDLSPLSDGLWLWAVDDPNIAEIREQLGRRRLLVCYGGYDTPSGGPVGHTYGQKAGSRV